MPARIFLSFLKFFVPGSGEIFIRIATRINSPIRGGVCAVVEFDQTVGGGDDNEFGE